MFPAASSEVMDSAVHQHPQVCGQHQRWETILNEQLPRYHTGPRGRVLTGVCEEI